MAKQPKTLTHDEVAALAESVGLPGETFAQIAKGESGYQPGIVGHDPGGTQGLGLWQITTHWNDDIIKRFGGRDRLLNDPLANARAAKAIFDRQGIGAWYGTKYMTGTNLHYKGGASPPPSVGNTMGAAAGPSGSGQPAAPGDPGTAGDFTGLLGQLLAKPEPVVQQMAVAPPSFSARAPLPQGFQAPTPEPQMAPAQADPVSGALGLLETLRGTDPASAAPGAGDAAGGPQETVVTSVMRQRAAAKQNGGVVPLGGSKNAGKGSFEISGPDPGRLKSKLVSFADQVAAVLGVPIVGLDGSTHSKYTVNNNISDHWAGNATDIFTIGGKPATGATLLRAGRAALIAAGMPREQALKAQGGLYNVNGHQIIFSAKGDAVGGDHTDHLHISAR